MAGFYPQLIGPALDAFNRSVRDIRERAMRELNLTKDNVVIRSLIPEDLGRSGANTKHWRFVIASTDTTANALFSAVTLADNRFVVLNGITLDTGAAIDDHVTQIEVTRKGSVARLWSMHYCAAQDDRTVYFDDPVTVDQNTTFTINLYTQTAATEGVAFLGAVAEKRGMLVNPIWLNEGGD